MVQISKKTFFVVVLIMMLFLLSGCRKPTLTPSVNFGFKITDGAGQYDESINSFEIGKRFYTCITIKLTTDKKKAEDYNVIVEIPKTSDVEVKGMGGLNPKSNNYDRSRGVTVLTYSMKGYKEAVSQKLLFYGTPTEEGQAKITVKITDKDGNPIDDGYFRTVFFVYTLNS